MSGDEQQEPVLVDPRPLLWTSGKHLLAWLLIAVVLSLEDRVLAKSVLLGAGVAIFPAAMMARVVFRFRKVEPRAFTRSVYRGEVGKLLVTMLLFAMAFTLCGAIEAWLLFTSFLCATAVQWLLAARLLVHD